MIAIAFPFILGSRQSFDRLSEAFASIFLGDMRRVLQSRGWQPHELGCLT